MSFQLETAYAVCRDIARSRARNFYYAFLALPGEKRNAICAVYAFMRHADDLADDESLPPELRGVRLRRFLDAWHQVVKSGSSDDPVFVALKDTQQRFGIPDELLDQLVRGAFMDLADESDRQTIEDTVQKGSAATLTRHRVAYHSFQDLRSYCYYVASVVGLVCIRIFGYRDVRAERLAEDCGVAFQLTNIIRDVKEDAIAGRVYLPEEDLVRFGVDADSFHTLGGERTVPKAVRDLLAFQAERARAYYRAGHDLLGLIDDDSRPALWVLVTIYERLLNKIIAKDYNVFGDKIRLSGMEKSAVLGIGVARALFS